jgi:hypothetical protein
MGSQKGMDELEVIDPDTQKVIGMIGALPRVEAPSNFEFRVKAGIAKGSPARYALLPLLKTAAPLALILLVVSLGLLYYQTPTGTEINSGKNVAAVSEPVLPPVRSSEPARSEQPSVVPAPSRETTSAQAQRVSVEPDRNVGTRRTGVSNSDRSQGGSVDRILHPGNVIMPPGTESANPKNLNANTAGTSASVPVRDVLGMFGVEGDFADGGWKVRSVKDNSVGSRAKIAAGDVIESIDGQALKNETKLKGSAKTFTVRRDGKLITLSAGN